MRSGPHSQTQPLTDSQIEAVHTVPHAYMFRVTEEEHEVFDFETAIKQNHTIIHIIRFVFKVTSRDTCLMLTLGKSKSL